MTRTWIRGEAAICSLLIASVLVGGCSGDTLTGGVGAGGAERGAVEVAATTVEVDSPDALAVVKALRERFRWHVGSSAGFVGNAPGPVPRGSTAGAAVPTEVIGASVADRVERESGGWLRPHLPDAALRGVVHKARVMLPARATGAFQLADLDSGLSVEVALAGARDVPAEVAEGFVVYRGAHVSGGDVVHRTTAEGTEDYVAFERAPAVPELQYQIALGEKVAGVRLMANTLELLDASGTPRLRMTPPYAVDATGERNEAHVEVSGCAYDQDPRGPWKRATVAPGARRCSVRIGWGGAELRYPVLVDPLWTSTGSMSAGRDYHTANALTNGKALVVGGYNNAFLTSAEVYDPATGTWSGTASLATGRDYHTASVLVNGKVLVAGGYGSGGPLISAEVYDPATGTWSGTANMVYPRYQHTANVLPNGKVFLAGGGGPNPTAEVYDPATATWSATANMNIWRYFHTASVLPNGKVLVAGGAGSSGSIANAEVCDPATGTWTGTGSLVNARSDHTASVLPNGKVVVVGGYDGAFLASAEVYDPATGTWSGTANLTSARYYHTASVLASGTILVAGGFNNSGSLASAELYDPMTGSWSTTASLATARYIHTSSVLTNGTVLLAGGNGLLSSAEVFTPIPTGASCASRGECISGFCVDGVCCAVACSGVCQACSMAKTGVANGACAPVQNGTDPDNDCAAQAASTCSTVGVCNGAGACVLYASGTSCAPAGCQNGTLTNPTCDGLGICQPGVSSCGLYSCANASVCATSCTNDAQCLPSAHCRGSDGTCQSDRPGGASCTSAAECQAGSCVDGVCCDTSCAGQCMACVAAKTGGTDGTCAPVQNSTDPDNECGADVASTCQHDGQCNGAGACRLYAQGVSCGPTTCSGNLVKGQICDGLGACTFTAQGTDCAPFVCQGSSCANPCVNDAQCVPGNHCAQGTCTAKGADGTLCAAFNECQSGFCVEGVCCDAACNGTCQACKATNKASGPDGTCGLAKDGADPHNSCTDEGVASCNHDGSCDGNGACRTYPTGTVCGPTVCLSNAPATYTCKGAGMGACLPVASAPDCGLYLCVQGGCTASCTTSADCAKDAWCNVGVCVAKKAQGDSMCAVDEECASGHCADAFCCDVACDGQCEACNVMGAPGTCVPVSGDAPAGRPACEPAAAGNPCSKRTCDGTGRTSCDGFAGTSLQCRAASCVDGTEILHATCDGQGNCPTAGPGDSKKCDPFICDVSSCKTTCAQNADCAEGYHCQGGNCLSGATCDGDHTIITATGETKSCSPYRCDGNGTCKTSCGSVDDCVQPSVCDQQGACNVSDNPSTGQQAGCATAPARPGMASAWATILVGGGLLALRRRRTRSAPTRAFLLRGWLSALTLAAVVGCSVDDRSAADPGRDTLAEGAPSASTSVTESTEAYAVLERLRARFRVREESGTLGLARGVRVERTGEWLRPQLPEGAELEIVHRTTVKLPAKAAGAFQLADIDSGVSVEVALAGANDAPAEVAGGYVVYRGAYGNGADVIHRRTPDGSEDYVAFDRAPEMPVLRYEVALGDNVAGVRLVANTLELLDAGGVPRLRMAPPYVLDATGEKHDARVSVSGCAHDLDPRGPWGRPVVLPGARRCVVRVAWTGAKLRYPALVDPLWTSTGNMAATRNYHVAAVIASSRVLVAGGYNGSYLASAEVYDPATGTWSGAGSMTIVRTQHTASVLANGMVLVAGGRKVNNVYLSSAELYDPVSGAWSVTGSMASARGEHAACVLTSGKVVVAGGYDSVILASAEVYDPATGTWSGAGSMASARYEHTASALANGTAFMTGGKGLGFGPLTSAEAYDPATGSWSAAASMANARFEHTASVLANGTVLVAGGYGAGYLASAEVFTLAATGALCSSAGGCASSFCVDGVCCAVSCAGICQACSAAKTGVADGICAPVPNGLDPDNDCAAQAASTCSTVGVCNGAGACLLYASGTSCAPAGCQSGTLSTPICNGLGICQPNVSSCGLNLCAGSSACATSCANDTQCIASAYCQSSDSTCQPDQPSGGSCTSASQCQSGSCVDGVCCDTTCIGACKACTAAKTGGVDGTCAPIQNGTDPDNECVADAASTCQYDGQCNGAGACRLYGQGVSCGPTTCSGNLVKGNVCDGLGTCSLALNGTDCAPYVCQGSSCTNPCASDAQCVLGAYCAQGTCAAKGANGTPCAALDECQSGFCVEGICCDTACNGTCQACTAGNKVSGPDGTCDLAKNGSDPHDSCTDDGVASCNHDGSCDGNGACRTYPASTVCGPTVCLNNAPATYTCKGAGMNACLPDTSSPDCGLYLCVQGGCTASCSTSADCGKDAWCNAGACEAKSANSAKCTTGEACESTLCVDGVCCNAPCQGQCEACDVTKNEGTCIAVSGTPHGTRPMCDPASMGNPCSEKRCDNIERTVCNSFVDNSVHCRDASCTDGVAILAASCTGDGSCPDVGPDNSTKCDAFACDTDACKTTCATSADCAKGYHCDAGSCLPGSCDGDHTVITETGATVECAPYKCDPKGGGCLSMCASVDQCAAPNVCSDSDPSKASQGQCTAPSSSAVDSGCSTTPSPSGAPAAWLSMLVLAGLAATRRRSIGRARPKSPPIPWNSLPLVMDCNSDPEIVHLETEELDPDATTGVFYSTSDGDIRVYTSGKVNRSNGGVNRVP